MNYFVHRMLGHFLMDEIGEDGAPGAGADVEQEEEIDQEAEQEEHEEDDELPLDGEVIVSLGDEPAEESEEEKEAKSAPKWVKELRKDAKEKARRIRELEQQLQQREQVKPEPEIEIGKKPTLEDFDYDTEKFESEYEAWLSRKRQVEEKAASAKRQQEEAQSAWQARLDNYAAKKEALKVRDYEDAEYAIKDKLDDNQRSILIAGLDDPALMVYALGKNSEQLARIAAIKDPIKFAMEIGKLETQVKTKARQEKPAPEKRVSPGSGSLAASTDRTLEQLRAEAEKTGDYTKVHAYKRQLKQKQG